MDSKTIETKIDGVVVEGEVAPECAIVMIGIPVHGKKDTINLSPGEAKKLMDHFGIENPNKLDGQKVTVDYNHNPAKVYGRN